MNTREAAIAVSLLAGEYTGQEIIGNITIHEVAMDLFATAIAAGYAASASVAADLSDDMDLVYAVTMSRVYFLNPVGADRAVNPSGTFPSGSTITIFNTGAYQITFDSSGLNQAVGGGNHKTFYYNVDDGAWYA